jgi:hypothetical protein
MARRCCTTAQGGVGLLDCTVGVQPPLSDARGIISTSA